MKITFKPQFVGAAQLLENWYELVKVQMSVLYTIVTVAVAMFAMMMCFDSLSTYRHDRLDFIIIGVFVVAVIILRVMIGFGILWILSIIIPFVVALLIYSLFDKLLKPKK